MTAKNHYSIQQTLLKRIKEVLPSTYSLADELADLLEISIDSAYRRIRGETPITIHEVTKICNYFKISFDSLAVEQTNSVTFRYDFIDNQATRFKHYLNTIKKDIDILSKTDEKQIIYAAEDIPVFYHFAFPELAAFKMFYWMKSVLNINEYESQKFSPGLIDDEIIETGKQILLSYQNINSIEIWSDGIYNSLFKQIEFYWEAGLFHTRDDAIKICDLIEEEIFMFQKLADTGSKNGQVNNTNFHLYISDIEIGNNTILTTRNNQHATYITHHTFNFLATTNVKFCQETLDWLNHLIKKSNLISGVSEKQRFIYFKKLLETCSYIRNKIIAPVV